MSLQEAHEVGPVAPGPTALRPSARLAAMLEHPTLAAAAIREGRVVECNAPWRALFAWPPGVSADSHVAALFPNVASAERFERELRARLSDDGSAQTARSERTLLRRDGSAFVAELVVSPLEPDHADRPPDGYVVWQVRDITVERTLRRELRDLEDYHRELARHQWDMTFVIDRKGRISYASPSIEGALGYRVHAMLGQPFASLLERGHVQDAEQWLRAAGHSRNGTGDVSHADGFLLRVLQDDGQIRVLACRLRDCFDVPRIAGMVVHARDVTEAQPPTSDSREGRSPPRTVEPSPVVPDPLTGLPLRVDAERHIAAMIAATADAASVTVFFVDLDHLQHVNDAHGLAQGDAVIARAARILREIGGDAGFVARVGSDEFVVVAEGMQVRDADALAQAMLDGLGGVTDGVADSSSTDASIGVARFPDDAQDVAALLLQADLAMREAKSRGRAQTVVFNARFVADLQLRKALDAEIEGALQRDEFTMFYQPQIALQTGEVVGLEALLRWQHPTRGMLLPDAFIGTAFRRGLIDAITKTALVQVCEQIAAWRRLGDMPEVPVAVNVSVRQFHDRRLPALIASALLKSGLPARLLVLEITEQNLVGDDAAVQRVVKELSRLGVRIAVGGFNIGHASFRHLRRFGVSQIKLDGMFVQGLPDDTESAIVVAAVVDLARRLKYQVIAEGVETREQRDLLRQAGCEVGQGFHFGTPQPADEIRAYLASKRRSPSH